MSKLNKDTLFLIFEELQDDSKFLFSCLMVNRLWSETVIPILWRNPWNYDINYSNKSYLFTIIAYYLPNDIKEFLTRQGIQLPSPSYKSLLFDYLSFCRSININTIKSIISTGSSLAYNQFLLQQEFYSIFMKKFPEYKYLDIKSIQHQIFYLPKNNIQCLESLCELKCDNSIDSSYFYGLARFCQNIQKFIIVNITTKVNHGIIKLIEVQKNLKYFELKDDFEDDYYYSTNNPYEGILLELEKKTDNLNHLKMCFQYSAYCKHTLLHKILPKFCRLKTLIISDFFYFTEEEYKMLIYHDLEILKVDFMSLNAASKVVENSGGHLRKILLEPYDFEFESDFDKDSLNFICKIYENCPSIEYISLVFPPSKEHFTEFEKLLKVCQKLKSLLLIVFNFDENEINEKILENGEELLKVLAK